jgi:hypothetical protein
MKTYTYSDSEAGNQSVSFEKLSEMISYLENFSAVGESYGVIYQNEKPILEYHSNENGLSWSIATAE